VIVTRDKDYLRLDAAGQPHAGIVYCTRRTRTVGDLVSALVLIHEVLTGEEMFGHSEYA
jgi:hypothetical protein